MGEAKRKADSVLIANRLDNLAATPPGDAEKWWPKFVYHFTDILNAVQILESNLILSRHAAIEAGLMKHDNASIMVIRNTSEDAKRFARFYFRPRTPTQWNNEGFRPVGKRENDSHCPIPIYFLLDAKQVLTLEQSSFSDGNLAAGSTLRSSGTDFIKLPFDKIYHSSSLFGLERSEARNIIYHRHAEVVVPGGLGLDENNLKFIWCRSAAERRTLLHLLKPETRRRWRARIGSGSRPVLFNRRWTYVEDAALSQDEIRIKFNPSTCTPGPFNLRVEITELQTGQMWEYTADSYAASGELLLSLRTLQAPHHYTVECYLDDHIAFGDTFIADDNQPF